jgi:hypothetical protein
MKYLIGLLLLCQVGWCCCDQKNTPTKSVDQEIADLKKEIAELKKKPMTEEEYFKSLENGKCTTYAGELCCRTGDIVVCDRHGTQ